MVCSACHDKPTKKPCGACGKLPPVLEIHNEECPILFHTVELDASYSEDPPYIGRYKNVLCIYKVDDSWVLYNSDGIYSVLGANTNFNALVGRPRYAGEEMTSATNIPDVTESVAAEAAIREEADNTLSGRIDNLLRDIVDKIRKVNTLQELILGGGALGELVLVLGKEQIDDGEGAYYLINDVAGEVLLDNGMYAKLVSDLKSNYYDEVTIKSGIVNVSGTDKAKAIYYIATIPKLDKFGDPITLHVVSNEGLKPSQYARAHNSTLTTNASLAFPVNDTYVDGIVIGDGVILNNYSGELPEDYGAYLGIKDDNVIELYPKTISAQDMLADGVKQCVFCFGSIVENGAVNEAAYNIDSGTMSFAIGQKADGTIILFGNDGRCYDSPGLTVREVANILISEGCVNAWELDGGGSTSITYHGTKINQAYDDHRTHERTIGYLFNVQHEIKDQQVANDVSTQGEIQYIKDYRIQKQLERYEYKHSYLKCNINNTVFTTGNPGTIITFSLSSPSSPVEIPLVYDESENLYGFKFWRKGIARINYSLQIENPTNGDVNVYVDLMNGNSTEYTVSAKIRANSWQPLNLNWLSLYYQTYSDTKYLRLRANTGLNDIYIPRGTINVEFIPTEESY